METQERPPYETAMLRGIENKLDEVGRIELLSVRRVRDFELILVNSGAESEGPTL